VDAHLRELELALEVGARPSAFARPPAGVARIEHEPAVFGRHGAVVGLLEPGFANHDCEDRDVKAVVLVEGISDQIAVQTLAARRHRDLAAEGVSVVPIGGAQAIGRFLARYGDGVRLAGLCDAGEEPDFRRALERAGLGSNLDRAGMERLGFYVCEPDLEAELIRALGAVRIEEIAAKHGDLSSFRTLQKQPEWRGRPVEEQLRRFLGSGGRRKTRYAGFLVEALGPTQVPRPLDRLLAHV
jgi:hypothetical protein